MYKLSLLTKFFIIIMITIFIIYLLKRYIQDTFSNLINLTIFFPYYNNLIELKKNIYHYNDLSPKLKEKIEIFIVDDGSNKIHALDILKTMNYNLNLTLYRINIDIPWNMPETNNLAFKFAKYDILLRTDIDNFIDEKNLLKIFDKNICDKNMYFFDRYLIDLNNKKKKIKYHPNTYLISKQLFDKIGGYNESFSGNYGYDDIEFIKRKSYFPIGIGFKKKLFNHYLYTISSDLTKNLNRNTTKNKLLYEQCIHKGCEHIKYKNRKYYSKELQTKYMEYT